MGGSAVFTRRDEGYFGRNPSLFAATRLSQEPCWHSTAALLGGLLMVFSLSFIRAIDRADVLIVWADCLHVCCAFHVLVPLSANIRLLFRLTHDFSLFRVSEVRSTRTPADSAASPGSSRSIVSVAACTIRAPQHVGIVAVSSTRLMAPQARQ